ncbi:MULTISPECIES: two-partner secretion domain-containing protein [Nostocales]|uniref:Filamentous hemagglutinin N-terminal domain-containing protein n=3 Tax=Nostocales TaxID=1161 RepID=A0A0C1R8T4_9CYAN|nr:filamentous hemagglutinin N-terminal domain-containing protein [Tolypothrix bouteillei]KAF3890602.1 filamentous hemagglutinin N-terminal domain-containing protein [Tolypothrix bouteillei VB521301]
MMGRWIIGWKLTGKGRGQEAGGRRNGSCPLPTAFLNLGIWLVLEGIIAVFANSTLAQELRPLADNTLGEENSVVTPVNAQVDRIDGGAIRGTNLFHSFSQFNIGEGREVYFANPSQVQNILSRVTGADASQLLGKLSVLGNANLFLINPNGIIFGKNASLDIRGSFLASTASQIKFADAFEFTTNALQTKPLLTVSVPTGLQFGGKVGSIQNQSTVTNSNGTAVGLQVQPERTLALVGGFIALDGGSVQAANGRIELAAVAERGTVGLSVSGSDLSLDIPPTVERADISLINAKIDVSDRSRGSIEMIAKNINISGESLISAGIGENLTATGLSSGNITLNATDLIGINYPSRVVNVVSENAIGNAGDININAGTIKINNRASDSTPESGSSIPAALNTGSLGTGRAGNVSLFATGSMELLGQDTNSLDEVISTYNYLGKQIGGGDIRLEANRVYLNNAYLNATGGYGGLISVVGKDSVSITENSFLNGGTGSGDAKDITVESNGIVTIDRSWLGNNVGGEQSGNAGNIKIAGQAVYIIKGSLLETRSEANGGNSGNIQIDATGRVEISGIDPTHGGSGDRTPNAPNSLLSVIADSDTRGNPGDITIKAGEIYITNRNINGGVFPALNAGSSADRPSGKVSLSATTGSIALIGQDKLFPDAIISTYGLQTSSGGGDISLTAKGSIFLQSAYVVSARANGGNISLIGNDAVSITENSFLNAGTTQGNSGSITIQSNGPVIIQRSLVGNNVGLSERSGNVGNTKISGKSVSIIDGSLIEASSERSGGNSGSIDIDAVETVEISGIDPLHDPNVDSSDFTKIFPYTVVTATSNYESIGQAGNINITARTLRVSNGASIRAQSQNARNSGNINIDAKIVELTSGGQLLTNAAGSGNAGNISIKNSDRILISGSNSNYDAVFEQIKQTYNNSYPQIVLGAGVSPTDGYKYILGYAGPNSGIFASTELTDGGNITLNVGKVLQLRHNGQISAKAGERGKGGNITINASNGFIVAVLKENSDIIAQAVEGSGGRITINAAGIYGLENRTQLSSDDTISEINASSEFGTDGSVELNTFEFEPNIDSVNLPTVPVDTQISQNCNHSNLTQSKFTITGRGGLPPNPNENLTSDAVLVNWITPASSETNNSNLHGMTVSKTTIQQSVTEATGWTVNQKGEIFLTARPASVTSHSPWSAPILCSSGISK